MSLTILDDAVLLVAENDYSANDNSVALSFSRKELDAMAMGDTVQGVRMGARQITLGAEIYYDSTDDGNDETVYTKHDAKTECPVTVGVASTVGSVAYNMLALVSKYEPKGSVDEMYKASVSAAMAKNAPFARGVIAANANITTTTTGAVASVGPVSTTQQLVSNLHVTSVAGAGITLTETVEASTVSTFEIGKGYMPLVTGISGNIWGLINPVGSELVACTADTDKIWYSGADPYNPSWSTNSAGISNPLNALVYALSTYVTVGLGGSIYTNPAVTGTWTSRVSGTAGAINSVVSSGVAFTFYACGAVDAGTGYISTSPDSVTWTRRTVGVPAEAFYSIADNGVTVNVVGANRSIYKSTDGVNWSVAASSGGGTEVYRDIKNANGVYVVVGDSGLIATSTNGDTYTQRASGVTLQLYKVGYIGASKWLCVGQSGVMLLSVDNGVTWAAYYDGTGQYSTAMTVMSSERCFIFGSASKTGVTVGAYQILAHTQVTTAKTSEQKLLTGQQPYSHYRAKSTVTGSPTYKVTHSIGIGKS